MYTTTMDISLMKKRQSSAISSSPGMHGHSQMISKPKPKIRIIHIFAPEIIKTDVANFRELVQRLTGKPTSENKTKKRLTKRPAHVAPPPHNILEIRTGFRPAELRERIKGEEEKWAGPNSGGGFLGGFEDLDGFMQELNAFPVLPLDLDVLGDHHPQLA